MANYLNGTGLQTVLKHLNESWMGDPGVLGYSKVSKQTYPVLRSGSNKLGKLYIDVTDIWNAIDALNTAADGIHAFKNVTVGDVTVSANSVGDTLKLTGSSPISMSANAANKTVTISHSTSSVTAGSYGAALSSNKFSVPVITVDSYGHLTAAASSEVTLANYYPTSFAWTDGTTSGPTGSLTGSGMNSVSFGAIPTASANNSGVVTIGAQTFAGDKTFTGSLTAQGNLSVSGNITVTGSITNGNGKLNADTLGGQPSSYFAVQTEVDKAIENLSKEITQKVTGLFEYKGTIGTGGTVTSLPAKHEVGDVYYVKTAGTYAGISCEVGDMIICNTNGETANNSHWNVVNANWTAVDGTSVLSYGQTTTLATIGGVSIDAYLPEAAFFNSVKAADGNTINGANNTLEFTDDSIVNVDVKDSKLNLSHANSGVTTGSYGDTAAKTPAFGGTFSVPSFTVDKYGHLTVAAAHNVTIPSSAATTSANGLMSSTHVTALNTATTKLSNIADNATSDSALTTDQIVAAFSAGMGLTVSAS